MGQKINSTGLRLKKRLNWNSTFSTHNQKDFSNFFFENQQLSTIVRHIFTKQNLLLSHCLTKRSSKKSLFFSKYLLKQDMYKSLSFFTSSSRISEAKKEQNLNQHLLLKNHDNLFFFSSIEHHKKLNVLNNISNKVFLMFSPKILSYFLAEQLKKNTTFQTRIFSTNIKKGIIKILPHFFSAFKNTISGIKIECSGKWKKTKSGRKQRFVFQIGKVKTSSLSNILFFDSFHQKTKFGVCGIKLWISTSNADRQL